MLQWSTKKKQRIVANDAQAFEEIRLRYFPNIPASQWKCAEHVEQAQEPGRITDNLAKG